jgi:hypothetical protein
MRRLPEIRIRLVNSRQNTARFLNFLPEQPIKRMDNVLTGQRHAERSKAGS